MAPKAYWYDGMMDADDLPAIELLRKEGRGDLVGLSECFHSCDRNDDIRSRIEKAASLKIHNGAQRPIIRQSSCMNSNPSPVVEDEPENGYAWDAIYAAAKCAGKLTLFCAGSLTNITLAILRYHDLVDFLDRIVFIAGTVGIGDHFPMSEDKATLDPYAMKTVLTSGVKLLYIGYGAWTSKRVTPVEMISSVFNIDQLQVQKANMDIETAKCGQFARTIIDTRVRSKAVQNIEFIYIDHFF